MSNPTFNSGISTPGLSLEGGVWSVYDAPLTVEFVPGSSGHALPQVTHRISWGDGSFDSSDFLPIGRPYRYSHDYREEGVYTVEVSLVNAAGEASSASSDGIVTVRKMPDPPRQAEVVKYSGIALPTSSIRRALEAVDSAFPDLQVDLVEPARAGFSTIVVSARPAESIGSVVVITQDGKFISSGTVVSEEGNRLVLDAALESDYDAFYAQVSFRRNDLPRTLSSQPYKPDGWFFPRTVDRDLVQSSLALLFATRPMERVMRPDLGCAVYESVFAPNDELQRQILRRQLLDTAAAEPRARLADVAVTSDGDELKASATVVFAGFQEEIFETELPLSTFFR